MSGGSLDYVYLKVAEVANELRGKHNKPLYRAFANHLDKVSEALHDIEWVISCDYGEGQEDNAINKVLGVDCDSMVYAILREDALKLIAELEKLIK